MSTQRDSTASTAVGAAAAFPERIELVCGPVTAVDLSLYAAASGDRNPLHLDEDVAKAAGFERPIVHGMLTMAYCGRLMTTHFGVGALRSLAVRFVGPALRGEQVVLTATLKGIQSGIATYDIAGSNADGKDLVTGSACVGEWP
jgi:acyl dehydratase